MADNEGVGWEDFISTREENDMRGVEIWEAVMRRLGWFD
jgi:hypothetical protein